MLIYAFTELYPSPYKSYFDTQFEELLRQGHALRVFALGRQRGTLEAKVVELGLDKITSYVPSTVRDVGPLAGNLLLAPVRSPLAVARAVGRAAAGGRGGLKERALDVCRAALMPSAAPDLLLVHTLAALRRFRFARRLYPGRPIAFYYHGGETAGTPEIAPRDARLALDAADVVFTNTESSKAHVIARGCDAAKVHVIPVGFKLAEFEPSPDRRYRGDGLFRLLSIGRMSREKGFIHGLEAVAQLVAQGATFIRYGLVGSGPERAALQTFIAAHRLEPYVTLHGQVSRQALIELLEQADAFLLPSTIVGTWQENQACVVQEAMLMRTPVIATATGGVPESLAPALHPYLVPPEQPAAMADRIMAMAQLSAGDLQALGSRGRDFAVAGYDIEGVTRRLLEIATSGTARHGASSTHR
jgi:glycosyltransferase involved in cell wall biosynthesis